MNWYIQGDAANADKIKAAFETKAIYSNLSFTNENYLYYSCDGTVAFCFIGGGLANIIKTHPDYQELELPVEPKFKVGDKVIYNGKERTITFMDDKFYDFDGGCAGCRIEKQDELLSVAPKFKVGDLIVWTEPKGDKPAEPVKIIQLIDKDQLYMVDMPNGVGYVAYDMQDYYKLVHKPHYDISNFHAGMPVLVRDTNEPNERWQYVQFSHYHGKSFYACGSPWDECIPFEGNERLLGTTDMPDEMYINW